MSKKLQRVPFWPDERGQAVLEYILMMAGAAFVVLAIIPKIAASIQALGLKIVAAVNGTDAGITTPTSASPAMTIRIAAAAGFIVIGGIVWLNRRSQEGGYDEDDDDYEDDDDEENS